MTSASAHDVAREVRRRLGASVGTTKLHKLLFYVQAWSVAWRDEPSFSEAIEAFANGPVVKPLWVAEQHGRPMPLAQPVADDGVLDLVLGHYGSMTKRQLIVATHHEGCWQAARRAAGDDLTWLQDDPEGARWRDRGAVESLPISLEAMAESIRASDLFRTHVAEIERARRGLRRANRALDEDPERLAHLQDLLDR
jgi:uncharacterized phage-associated protein